MTVPSRWCGFLSISRHGSELLYVSRDETSSLPPTGSPHTMRRLSLSQVGLMTSEPLTWFCGA